MKRNYVKKDEVTRLLHEGWEIIAYRNEVYGKKRQLVYQSWTYRMRFPGQESKHIHSSTMNSLIAGKIIQPYAPYNLLQPKKTTKK